MLNANNIIFTITWLIIVYEWVTIRLYCTFTSYISRGLGRFRFCGTWSLKNWEKTLFFKNEYKITNTKLEKSEYLGWEKITTNINKLKMP